MDSIKRRDYQTEVLVLGSGAAGCAAAITAARAGAKVLLVDKGVLESSGNLGGGNDHFMAVLDHESENDDLHALEGFFGNPFWAMSKELIRKYYAAMKPAIATLEDAGVELMKNDDGSYMRSLGFGQPGPWWIHINHGYTVKPKLAKYIKKLGVNVLNNFMVTHLLKDGDCIAGCAGFDVLKGDFIVVNCKAAVMALGNIAERVSNNSTHKPYNVWFSPFVTGSQVILSLEAGAGVQRIDVSDCCTMLPKSWGAPGMNGINNMGGFEINALGERFMDKYDPNAENGDRKNQVLGTYLQITEGYGPPFYMDMRHFTPEAARHLQYDLMPGDKETYLDYCRARDIDFSKKPLEVEISERGIGGVLWTDDNQETEIKNLFNGCGGMGFSGSFCTGWNAGQAAAERAKSIETPKTPEGMVEEIRATLFLPLSPAPGYLSYGEFEDCIRQVVDYYLGFKRTWKGLECALNSLSVLKENVSRLGAQTLREFMRVREAMELFKFVNIYVQAVMQRKESGRAQYMIAEYPKLDPKYNKILLTKLDADGNPVFSWIE